MHAQAWDDHEALTVTAVADRLALLHGARGVSFASGPGAVGRRTYAEVVERARRAASALAWLGVRRGDQVATLLHNQPEHLELYLAAGGLGAVLHTLDPWLPGRDLRAIHAAHRVSVIVVDATWLGVLRSIAGAGAWAYVVVSGHGPPAPARALAYEQLLAWGAPRRPPAAAPDQPAVLCHLLDAAGRPRPRWATQQALVEHGWSAGRREALDVQADDRVLPAAAMYTPEGWGAVFAALIAGAELVLPGARLDAPSILDLVAGERVTVAAGTLGLWSAVVAQLEAAPRRWDLSALRRVSVAGGPASASIAQALAAWGVDCVWSGVAPE